jgi:amino acid transporter
VSEQERWENHSGYSPATIASAVAGLVFLADLLKRAGETAGTERYLMIADRWQDGAVPGWRSWHKVSNHRVPVYAMTAICVLAWALMLPTLANAFVGYLVGTSIAVIGLYIAFAIPIYLRLRQGDRFEHGAGSLDRHYR